eukprot:GFYU01042556.1.p1 GENE.GFYU01042556.1~~GFYU01042556.1.p1  ORF type:complete len:108 (-),score=7.61 GFYU01042556.1:31-354(-)
MRMVCIAGREVCYQRANEFLESTHELNETNCKIRDISNLSLLAGFSAETIRGTEQPLNVSGANAKFLTELHGLGGAQFASEMERLTEDEKLESIFSHLQDLGDMFAE